MAAKKGEFSAKLAELTNEYLQMQHHLETYGSYSHDKVLFEIEELKNEILLKHTILQKSAEQAKSPIASFLAKSNLDYSTKITGYLYKLTAARSGLPEKADKIALYSEYSIDCATLAIKQTLLSALISLDYQMQSDEKLVKSGNA